MTRAEDGSSLLRHAIFISFAALSLFFTLDFNAVCASPSPSSLINVIAFSSFDSDTWKIVLLEPETGRRVEIGSGTDEKHNPAISPDHLTVTWATNLGEIWVWSREKYFKLNSLPRHCNFPAWHPDGSRLVCACFTFSNRQEDSSFYLVTPSEDRAELLLDQAGIQKYPRYTPDGKLLFYSLAFIGQGGRIKEDIWSFSETGEESNRVISNGACNIHPVPSPCGKWLIYASDIGGNMDVWKAKVDGTMQVQLTHHRGFDAQPCWSPDGRQIVFVSTRSGRYDLWVMDSNGENKQNITADMKEDSRDPFWGVVEQKILSFGK